MTAERATSFRHGFLRGTKVKRLSLFLFAVALVQPVAAEDHLSHALTVMLDPATHRITATDNIKLPRGLAHGKSYQFILHKGLAPKTVTPNVTLAPAEGAPADEIYEHFVVTLPPGAREFQISYSGEINHPLSDESSEMSRGMRESVGIIDNEGVFLEGASGWYPRFDEGLVAFTLEAHVPTAWDVISQGARTRHDVDGDARVVGWEEMHPQDEIYLMAAPFSEYSKTSEGTQAMIMLRAPDDALAQTYLDATVKYVNMYSNLLGSYPYAKFALVENFWETGFGMPSFTLLGSKVIRLPFIVYSSYPHEILHNWWGNGVYVDYATGNWSEGLTSYLADHLFQEQRGDGAAHRRGVLQKYTDFVRSERDFPLTEFRSRHSAVTEAVGYGKTLMLFHMLRLRLGDAAFVKALREFYAGYRFQVATFDDVKNTFQKSSGLDLGADFDPWVKREGAPQLKVTHVRARADGAEFVVQGKIEQTQKDAPFAAHVPVAISLENTEMAFQATVPLTGKSADFEFRVTARPLRLDVDPEFDVFRRLDPSEVPPALSQLFGAEKVLILVPAQAAPKLRDAYQALANTWKEAAPSQIEIRSDKDFKNLPKDRAVWVLGWENRHRPAVAKALEPFGVAVINQGVRMSERTLSKTDHPVVISAPNPTPGGPTVAWLATMRPDALPVLARKLPHYARYSFLGFEGEELKNIVKGQWPVISSALSVTVPVDGVVAPATPAGKLAPRPALIQ